MEWSVTWYADRFQRVINHDDQYARVMFPARVTIAGRLLMPLSIGHALLLSRFKSPLVQFWERAEATSVDFKVGDVAMAIWVCSRSATSAMESIGNWWTTWSIKRIANRLLKEYGSDFSSDFILYMMSGLTSPRVRRPSNAKMCVSPTLGMLKQFCMEKLHLTHAEALDYPMSLAYWDRAISLDSQGYVDFMTQADEDREEQARRMGDPEEVRRLFGIIGEDHDGN